MDAEIECQHIDNKSSLKVKAYTDFDKVMEVDSTDGKVKKHDQPI